MAKGQQFEVVLAGSGFDSRATAPAAKASGLESLVIEKAEKIGGGLCRTYGILRVGSNHLAKAAGIEGPAEDVISRRPRRWARRRGGAVAC